MILKGKGKFAGYQIIMRAVDYIYIYIFYILHILLFYIFIMQCLRNNGP